MWTVFRIRMRLLLKQLKAHGITPGARLNVTRLQMNSFYGQVVL